MVYVLQRETNLEKETIIESFRRVYTKYGTLEYPFSIQELDIWDSLCWPPERILNVAVKNARGAFRPSQK